MAVEGKTIVGFRDMDSTGYLDRLYVHKDYQKKGIAAAICDRLASGPAGKAAPLLCAGVLFLAVQGCSSLFL